jgi:hypothetical protein
MRFKKLIAIIAGEAIRSMLLTDWTDNDLVLRFYAATNVATKSKASYGLTMRGLFLVCFVTRQARVVLTR